MFPSAERLVLTRVLLFTGKGGVGKTSVAAATGVRAAAAGRHVLVTSTDPAHSLADVLDVPLLDTPTPLEVPAGSGRLYGQQIDAQGRLERHWHRVRDYLAAVLAHGPDGLGAVQAEELVLLPGLDELFALIDLNERVASGRYDLVVVDCAPTAETLRLLALPDALRWYADRVLGPGRRLARVARPLARGLGTVASVPPVPDEGVFAEVAEVHEQLAAVHLLLQDPGRSSLRIVTNPERLVISESQRTATSLSLFGYALDAVVVNRLLPDEVADPYLAGWRRRQGEQLDEIRRSFAPTPVLSVPLLEGEPIGAPALLRLAGLLYGDRDEAAVLHTARPVVLEDGHEPVLRIALPFAAEDDLVLHRRGSDLHVKVAGVKRTVPLPAGLARREVTGARLADGWLTLRFEAAREEVTAG